MDKRLEELLQLKKYTSNIEKEVTLLLQNLQWGPKQISEKCPSVTCVHDTNHRIPLKERETHEKKCYLSKLGYTKDNLFLPDPIDPGANTLVKLSKQDIINIINKESSNNPLFKKGIIFLYVLLWWHSSTIDTFSLQYVKSDPDVLLIYMSYCVGSGGPEPLTAARLQASYSADERLAIHDAVVGAAPLTHDLAELDIPSGSNEPGASRKKSRLEILAELRNMKRRRAKYRVAPKTRNYSHVLRDVIATQMETYGEATRTIIKTEYGSNVYVSQKVPDRERELETQTEIETPGAHYKERHRTRSRENKYNDDRREFRKERFVRDREKTHSDHYRDYGTEKNRKQESRHEGHYKKHNKDSSNDKNSNYDELHDSRDRTQGKVYKDKRKYREDTYLSIERRNNERHKTKLVKDVVIKQERASPESDSDTDTWDSRDRRKRSRSRERRHHDTKMANKKDRRERRDNRREIYINPEREIKEERTSEDEMYSNGNKSRKRYRERSKSVERFDERKRRYDSDKYSSRRRKEFGGRGMEFPPEVNIKQERESP